MDTNIYLGFIQKTLKTDGIKVADTANKLALKEKRITTDQYSAAARILVKEYLEQ